MRPAASVSRRMELWERSAVDLAAGLRGREFTAVEALQAVLARADAIAPALNPFAVRLEERALAAAERADERLARGEGGPLCGIPVTAKASHWVAGVETAAGSKTKVGFVPSESCPGVERLEAAGAVIFATTTVPEFSYSGVTESDLYGRTSNPWALDRTPGGSSGGAGAALAAMAGPLALGGDGGGSIRIPAAFCGVVGYKPTFGLVAERLVGRQLEDARLGRAHGPLGRRRAAHARRDCRPAPIRPAQLRRGRSRHVPAAARRASRRRLRGPRLRAGRRRRPRRVSRSRPRARGGRSRDRPRRPRTPELGADLGGDRDRRGPILPAARARARPRAHDGRRGRVPLLGGTGFSGAVRGGAVRTGADLSGLRRPVRHDRRRCAAHADARLRGLPARSRAIRSRSATSGSSRRGTTGRAFSTTRTSRACRPARCRSVSATTACPSRYSSSARVPRMAGCSRPARRSRRSWDPTRALSFANVAPSSPAGPSDGVIESDARLTFHTGSLSSSGTTTTTRRCSSLWCSRAA